MSNVSALIDGFEAVDAAEWYYPTGPITGLRADSPSLASLDGTGGTVDE